MRLETEGEFSRPAIAFTGKVYIVVTNLSVLLKFQLIGSLRETTHFVLLNHKISGWSEGASADETIRILNLKLSFWWCIMHFPKKL